MKGARIVLAICDVPLGYKTKLLYIIAPIPFMLSSVFVNASATSFKATLPAIGFIIFCTARPCVSASSFAALILACSTSSTPFKDSLGSTNLSIFLAASPCSGTICAKSDAPPPAYFWAWPVLSNKKGSWGSGSPDFAPPAASHLSYSPFLKLLLITISSKASLFLTCADKLLIPSTKVSIGFLVLPSNLSIIFLSIPVTSSKLVVTVSI